MKKNKEVASENFVPEIRRGRFDKLTIYEISESELETLERGSPYSLYLNFSIFILTLAFSSLITLFTTETTPIITTIFIIVAVVGILGGSFLFILWFKDRNSVSEIVKVIRKRLPPTGVQESLKDALKGLFDQQLMHIKKNNNKNI